MSCILLLWWACAVVVELFVEVSGDGVGDGLDDGLPPVDGGICDVPDVLDDLDSTGSGMDRLLIKVLSSRLLCLRCQMLKLL